MTRSYSKVSLYLTLGLQFLSLYLFTKGFFLVRKTLPNMSEQVYQGEQASRVILILVDALRIDFALSPQFEFLQDRLHHNPNQTLMYLSVADSPTAINTGNIPSFINLKANFQAESLEEDNLIWSLNRSNKTTVFVGDDTWQLLFPHSFTRMYPQDSFDVSDLHTVDNNVIDKVLENMNQTDWTMMIGHLLGLDHVGHSFDANSPNIDLKLIQYSKFLNDIYGKMDNNTVMVVIGDHGMSQSGNHGGDSNEETNTVIFACTKGPKRFNVEFYDDLERISEKSLVRWEVSNFIESSLKYNSSVVGRGSYMRKVSQIDLVPTLAILMGVSIPYNNIGQFLPEFLLINYQDENILDRCFKVCMANTDQLWKYIMHVQSIQEKFSTQIIEQWTRQFNLIKTQQDSALAGVIELLSLVEEIQQEARRVWNEYDYRLMEASVIFMFLTTGVLVLLQINSMSLQTKLYEQSNSIIEMETQVYIIKNRKIQTILIVLTLFMFLNMDVNHVLCILGIIVTLSQCYIVIRSNWYKMNFNYSFRKLRNLIQRDPIQDIQTNSFFQIIRYVLLIVFNPSWVGFALWYALQVSYAFIVFSLSLLRIEDYALFSIYIQYFMIYLIYQLICGSISIPWSLFHVSTFVLAEQYDKNMLRLYAPSQLRINSIQYIFQSVWLSLIIPAIVIQLILRKYLTDNLDQATPRLHKRIIRIYLHSLLAITQFYFCIKMISPENEQTQVHIILVPRVIYIFSFLGMISTFYLLRIQAKIIIPVLVTIPLFILSGVQSVAIFPIYFLNVYSLIKVFQAIPHRNGQIFFYGLLGIVSDYFWFMMGNRCQLASVNVERAYVGFRKFNFLLTGSLLALNQLSVFVLFVVFLPVISEAYQRKKSHQMNLRKHVVMYHTHFMIKVVYASFNCYLNTQNLLIVGDFVPKFIFDYFIYLGVTFFCILLI